MFDLGHCIADCRAALQDASPQAAVNEVVARAMSRPRGVEQALGAPHWAASGTLHRSPELTSLKLSWAPGMSIDPHGHRMWAVIGLYGGREANVFSRRTAHGLVQAGGTPLDRPDTTLLGQTVSQAVTTPLRRFTGAVHVYGGEFCAASRGEGEPETWAERPYDAGKATRVLAAAQARWRAQSAERYGPEGRLPSSVWTTLQPHQPPSNIGLEPTRRSAPLSLGRSAQGRDVAW